MKTQLFSFLLLLISVDSIAQTSLNFANNSLTTGDSNTYLEVQFTDPGAAGPNRQWDFSQLQFTDKNQCSSVQPVTNQKLTGIIGCNTILIDGAYEYRMSSTDKGLEELGYENGELKLSMVYSDPILKMKYPFSYGNQFTDRYAGEAIQNGVSSIDVAGDYTVMADAYGTLVLPDRVIKDALRVKSVKTGHQINVCGTIDLVFSKYSWYAAGYRYPILTLNVIETSSNGATPVITQTGYYNTQQLYQKSGALGMVSQSSPASLPNSEISVTVSPNPFTDQLTFTYALPETKNVSVEVLDMSGKTIGWLVKNQSQTSGLHKGELDASRYGLSPGVYFLRFEFDQQVVTHRVVKL